MFFFVITSLKKPNAVLSIFNEAFIKVIRTNRPNIGVPEFYHNIIKKAYRF